MNLRRCLGGALLLAAAAAAAVPAVTGVPAGVGESIYLRGVLGSGAPLQAVREGGGPGAQGADAACVNCHRHSGLGSIRPSGGLGASLQTIVIPPIAGKYLLQSGSPGREKPNLPYVDGMRTIRSQYTDETLARAIREGIDSEGRPLSYLMPRFAIGDTDMASLIGYLKTLDPGRVPGVADNTLHFATIITPDADPVRRRGMLDVIRKYFAERNSRQMVASPRLQASGKTQYSRTMFMVNRQWQLHVWDLTGPASTWQSQLEQHLAHEPVLAVISGLGGPNWAPVHKFCEKQALPCLFPNVEAPIDAGEDFYDLYFSKGVLLEAELIAGRILDRTNGPSVRVVYQVYRGGDSGEAGARALAAELRRRGVAVHDRVLPAAGGDVRAGVRAAAGGDALVLWLRPPDIAALGQAPASPATIFMSGLIGGLEGSPLPASWRDRTRMAYVFDLPQNRIVRVDYPLGWFRIRQIPVVDEQMQADTYLACGLLSEALHDMVDTFDRPYLIEQLQGMVEHRIVTGYYPRLTLAENQQFASKGGYIVHFADAGGRKLIADSDWMVP